MAIDRKYGKVTLEYGTIGEDEPVVVFRAREVMDGRRVEAAAKALCSGAGHYPECPTCHGDCGGHWVNFMDQARAVLAAADAASSDIGTKIAQQVMSHDLERAVRAARGILREIVADAAKYTCPWPGCGYTTDDRGEFNAHVAGHIRDESKAAAAQHEPTDDRTAQPVGDA